MKIVEGIYNIYKLGLVVLAATANVKSQEVINERQLTCVDISPGSIPKIVDSLHFSTCEQGKNLLGEASVFDNDISVWFTTTESLKTSTVVMLESDLVAYPDYIEEMQYSSLDEPVAASYGTTVYGKIFGNTADSEAVKSTESSLRVCTLKKASLFHQSYEFVKAGVCALLNTENDKCDELERTAKEDVARPTPFIYIP